MRSRRRFTAATVREHGVEGDGGEIIVHFVHIYHGALRALASTAQMWDEVGSASAHRIPHRRVGKAAAWTTTHKGSALSCRIVANSC
jgi:hypothetical protein